MNLDGLSILEVIEFYKKISAPPRKDVFTPLDRYLRERISTGEALENKELQRMPILVSFDEAVQFCEKVNLTEEVAVYKYLSKYLSKRISNKEIFKNDELEIAEVLKEQLEADARQEKKEKDRKKLYDKLRMLQFLTTVKSSLSSTDKLLYAKKVLVKEGRSSEFYIAAWDVVNELDKKNIDFCRLSFLLTKLIEESKKISKRVDNSLLLSNLINYLEEIAASDKIINSNVAESLNDVIKTFVEEYDSRFKVSQESTIYADVSEIRQRIKDGSIIINKEFPLTVLASIKLSHEQLEISNKTIIAIDEAYSLDLDGAFSILKDGDTYIFDVYITNVPSFLKENRRVSEEAYKRGTSLYLRNFDGSQIMIGMLPEILSNDYLSLLNNMPRDVLDFEFIFNDDGWLISSNVSRKQIRVTHNLTPGYVERVLDDKLRDFLGVRNNLLLYKELMAKVVPRASYKYLSLLRVESMYDFVAFPSVFTNYFITYKSQFLIYRDRGEYVKKPEGEPYSHSITPLRRFVSDINLAFFLNQEGVVSFDEKDLNYVEENIDEIIEHLNNQDRLSEFIDKNGYFVKKYLK